MLNKKHTRRMFFMETFINFFAEDFVNSLEEDSVFVVSIMD